MCIQKFFDFTLCFIMFGCVVGELSCKLYKNFQGSEERSLYIFRFCSEFVLKLLHQ